MMNDLLLKPLTAHPYFPPVNAFLLEVRDMIVTRPDIGFLRTDDDFILRFLRARKFNQTETFRLLAQYFQFRQQNLDMFQSFKVPLFSGCYLLDIWFQTLEV